MDLFITSYLPTTAPFETNAPPIGDSRYSWFPDNENTSNISASHRPNLVKFVQFVIALGVEVLPPTWDEHAAAREGLPARDGGTSNVKQSLVNATTALLYKRFRRDVPLEYVVRYGTELAEQSFREVQFNAMMNEITILAHPTIAGAEDGVVRLMGVCFEVLSSSESDIWPVAVLLKANQGDLAASVASQPIWRQVKEDSLLMLCGKIAETINRVHRCGVVHCDINPRNILFWLDSKTGAAGLMLADFGFSRYGATDDLTKLPRSQPWDAPEWHEREFTLEAARKTDVYAFGLLCFWWLFRDDSLADLGYPDVTVQDAFTCASSDVIAAIQAKKKSTSEAILEWALSLLAAKKGLDYKILSRIQKLLTLTLAQDPAKRAGMASLTEVWPTELLEVLPEEDHERKEIHSGTGFIQNERELSTSEPDFVAPNQVMEPEWHRILETPTLIFVLDGSDYRVQDFLARLLRQIAKNTTCDLCKTGASFQLSLFHRLGFGSESTDQEAKEWFDAAGITATVLNSIVEDLKVAKMKNSSVIDLSQLGYRTNLAAQYHRDGVQEEAKSYYRRVSVLRELALGRGHYSTLNSRHALADVLMAGKEYEDAWEVALQMTKLESLPLPLKTAVNSLLARLWMELGDREQAESTLRGLLDHWDKPAEVGGSERLDHQLDLIHVLRGERRGAEALPLSLKTLDECLAELGPAHTTTIRATRSLALAYDAEGQYDKAMETSEQLIKQKYSSELELEQSIDEAEVLVQDLANLGVQHYILGRHQEALSCYERVRKLINGDHSSDKLAVAAVDAVNNCAVRLIGRDDMGRAATILEALLSEASKILDEKKSKEIATVMGNLAYIYNARGEYEKEETLERRTVDIRLVQLGADHHHTVTAMGNLRMTLLCQGKKREALDMARQEFEAIRSWPSEARMAGKDLVVRSFEKSEAFSEAIYLLEPEIVVRQNEDIDITMTSRMLLASICYLQISDLPSTRKMMAWFLPRLQGAAVGEDDCNAMVDDLGRLATLWLKRGYTVEGEQVLKGLAVLNGQLASEGEDLRTQLEGTKLT